MWYEFLLVTQSCPTLCNPVDYSLRSPLSMNSPGKNTGVGSQSLLQAIFPIQGSNLGLLLCRNILYHLSHQGSLYTLLIPWPLCLALSRDMSLAFSTDSFVFSVLEKSIFFSVSLMSHGYMLN